MKLNIHKTAFAALVALFLLPLAAFAAVDYTPIDVAAVPMTAQTDLPQAADQFCHAYRQLLTFDSEQYNANYNYDNLVGSLVAASVVLSYDNLNSNFKTWTGVNSGLTSYALGYEDGSAKYLNLGSTCASLATSWGRLKNAYKAWADAAAECMAAPVSTVAAGICGIGSAVSLPILLANPHIGAIIGALAAAGLLLIAVICIAVGDIAFFNSLYAGGLLAMVPLSRRRRKRVTVL